MDRRSFLAGLAVAGLFPLASCRCSGDEQSSAGTGAPSTSSAASAAAEPTLAEQSFELTNGLAVDLAVGPCGEKVGIAVHLAVGIDHDPKGRSGMANLNERILRSSLKPGRGEQTVTTGDGFTLYATAVAPDALAAELASIAAWLKHVPKDEDLQRERAAVLAEIVEVQGENAAATARSLAEESLRPTRNGGKRRGVREQVEAITLEELQAFWSAHLTAGNARLVIVGAVDASAVRGHVETALAPLPRGKVAEPGEDNPATVKGTLVMGDAPSAVCIAVPAPPITAPAFPAFLGLAARLLREPAKARSWKVDYDPMRRPELLFIRGDVGPTEQPEPAAGRIRNEVGEVLAAPLAPEDALQTQRTFPLFLAPALTEPSLCAEDARAFAIARALRSQLGPPPALDASEAAEAEARALFGSKGSAAVIAGGTLPSNEPVDG